MKNVQRTIEIIQQANTALRDKVHTGPHQLKVWRKAKRKAMKELAALIGPQNVKQLSLYGKR